MATNKLSMLVRSFSTSNVASQMVKPPVQVFGIDGRYATALYSAASKQKTLDSVEKDLLKFQSAIKSDPKLREFIKNPTIKRGLKSEALKQIASKISLNAQTSNLLQTLADNGRLKNLDGVINAFKVMMAAHRGEVTCEVITARDLDAAQKSKLESVLKSFVKSSETIQLSTKVDPSIIGGMIVSIGDKYVDMSVASKIKKYTEVISTPV
ncbi:ATP synthase subunit O, mitochondrial [Tribolium castaneum]|uniref:Oligomycin sensitivity conferral protein n=1 Tax=Tribolium castaneum TaxID=7070 RepID=D6WA56_TRICA|nr:PREDICTED: ATP synthase subunit O, mitochondrial [Tribolium castaneum]EEZ99200.1 oligomycin sensitivity-conferring protein [Tribolium castaneum]|eukprot:XP_968733.1 PREDICTED: ATP synthase subunit O, mitochondrial [Tribolium castaneum]